MKSLVAVGIGLLLAGCKVRQPVPLSGPVAECAATTLTALQTRMEVCAHNIANAHTVGFKATRVITADSAYRDQAMQPDNRIARLGSGVRIAGTITDMTQGTAEQTSRTLDLFIDGKGFFAIRSETGDGGVVYTRAGVFSLNRDGEIRSGNADARMDPVISVPFDTCQILISTTGRVSVIRPGAPEPVEVGQIELTFFVNPEGLRPIGGTMFAETSESGPPATGDPGTDGRGLIMQGMLEGSNVNLISEQIEAERITSLYNAVSRIALPGSIPARVAAR